MDYALGAGHDPSQIKLVIQVLGAAFIFLYGGWSVIGLFKAFAEKQLPKGEIASLIIQLCFTISFGLYLIG